MPPAKVHVFTAVSSWYVLLNSPRSMFITVTPVFVARYAFDPTTDMSFIVLSASELFMYCGMFTMPLLSGKNRSMFELS